MMMFNEFKKLLVNKGVDDRTAYFLTLLFEQQMELSKALDDAAKIIDQMANALAGFVQLREQDQAAINAVRKRLGMFRKVDGVEVYSVAPEPE